MLYIFLPKCARASFVYNLSTFPPFYSLIPPFFTFSILLFCKILKLNILYIMIMIIIITMII